MQLTSEILTLLKKVYEDSFYTSSQLASQYASLPEFQDFFKMASIKCEKINQDLLRSKVSHPNLTDEEFIVYEVSKYAKVVIQKIKEEFGSVLPPATIAAMDKFKLEIVFDSDNKHDITAFSSECKVVINFPMVNGKNLNEKIINIMGALPHEIFHFAIQMLKAKELADEKMIYNLKDGRIASALGMVGHIFNEGFVEKISSEFCKKNNLFFMFNPSYISFTKVCDYIAKENPIVTPEFLFNHNYEDIFKMFSPELLEVFTEVERMEYANNFELKLDDKSYAKIDVRDIVSSQNVKISLDKKNDNEKKLVEYREFLKQSYLKERPFDSLLVSKFTILYGETPTCTHSLVEVRDNESSILSQELFDYNDTFISGMLQSAINDYGLCCPVLSTEVKPLEKEEGLDIEKVSVHSISENRVLLSVNNISPELAQVINNNLGQMTPVLLEQYVTEQQKQMQQGKKGPVMMKKNSSLQNESLGVVNIMLMSSMIGFMIGTLIVFFLHSFIFNI